MLGMRIGGAIVVAFVFIYFVNNLHSGVYRRNGIISFTAALIIALISYVVALLFPD